MKKGPLRKFITATATGILLMKAEAAAQLSKPGEAVALVNQVRARVSTRPPGTKLGSLSYAPTNAPAGTLPDLAGLAGQALLDAIWHERRVEFAEEKLPQNPGYN